MIRCLLVMNELPHNVEVVLVIFLVNNISILLDLPLLILALEKKKVLAVNIRRGAPEAGFWGLFVELG